MKYVPAIFALLFGGIFITCAPEKAAYNKELGPNDGGLVYLTQSAQSAGLLKLSSVLPTESATKTISACFGGLGVPKDNITVEFEVDQQAIDSMNNLRNKQELPPYSSYPAESFSLDKTSVTIPAGKECSSGGIQFVYKPKLFSTSADYLTAYRISKVSGGYKINKSISSILFVVVKPSLQPVDPSQLSATADSEEPGESSDGGLTNLNGYAMAAADGNLRTYWHSAGAPNAVPFPHWLLVNLGAVRYIGKIGLVRRTSKNDVFKTFDIEASLDGVTWVNLLKKAEMSNVFTVEQTYLTATTRCQFLKLTMTSAHTRIDHATLAEFIPYELK